MILTYVTHGTVESSMAVFWGCIVYTDGHGREQTAECKLSGQHSKQHDLKGLSSEFQSAQNFLKVDV